MIKLKKSVIHSQNKKRFYPKNPNIKNKIDPELCNRFRQIRKDLNLSQPEFAEILGTTRVAINAIEHHIYNPGLDLLRLIHWKYKLPYAYIIDGKTPLNADAV